MYQTGIFIDSNLLNRTDLTPSEKLYVAAARVSPDITQEQIAKMIGLSSRTIRRIEGQLADKKELLTTVTEQLPVKRRQKKADKLSGSRGTRVNDNFCPTDQTIVWAGRYPQLDIELETEKFINYWTSVSGARGVKLQWDRAFRNWLINAEKYRLQGETKNKKTSGIWDDIAASYESGHSETVRALGRPVSGGDEPGTW